MAEKKNNRKYRISLTNILTWLFVFILFWCLIAFTPLKRLMPGYPSQESRREMVRNAIILDSLRNEISLWKQQLINIQRITTGREPRLIGASADSTVIADSAAIYGEKWAADEQQLRSEVEAELKEELANQTNSGSKTGQNAQAREHQDGQAYTDKSNK